jgi:hypothetical protein
MCGLFSSLFYHFVKFVRAEAWDIYLNTWKQNFFSLSGSFSSKSAIAA